MHKSHCFCQVGDGFQCFYVDESGKKHGMFQIYTGYPKRLSSLAHYKHGKVNGDYKTWDFDGKLTYHSFYQNDIEQLVYLI